jgi:hypothetical protein
MRIVRIAYRVRDGKCIDRDDPVWNVRGRRAMREIAAYSRDQRACQRNANLQHQQQYDARVRRLSACVTGWRVALQLLDDHRFADFPPIVQHAIDLGWSDLAPAHIQYSVRTAMRAGRSFRRKLDQIAMRPHTREK